MRTSLSQASFLLTVNNLVTLNPRVEAGTGLQVLTDQGNVYLPAQGAIYYRDGLNLFVSHESYNLSIYEPTRKVCLTIY